MGIAQNQGPGGQGTQPYTHPLPHTGGTPPWSHTPPYAPPAPNGIPTPSPGYAPPQPTPPGPAAVGGAPGVYSYQIPGSPNMSQTLDTSAITSGLAGLNAKFNQLPLTPGMALGQSSLLSDFQNQLASAQSGYGNVAAQYNLGMGRMQTDQQVANEGLGSNMADRGILAPGSGAAAQQYTMQANDFNRQRQDAALQAQLQQADYIRQMQQAYGAYGQGLSGLALQSAQYSSGNPAY